MSFISFLRINARWLLVGFLLTLTSSWGQTFFISIFAGEIRAEFGLSHGAWGGIYSLGTTASAVVMLWGGALTDRFRVRSLGGIVVLGLAAACLAMSLVSAAWALPLVIFALRFAGQGMSTHLAGVAMARWFIAARGRALSVAMLGISAGQAFLPMIFAALLLIFDWRALWLIAAVMAALIAPLLYSLLRQERTPQSCDETGHSTGMFGRHWTRREALRSPVAWLMVPMLIGPPAWGTALLFQQVHLTEIKGWSLVDFVALFPLLTVASIGATFASGWAIDRFSAIRLIPFLALPWALTFVILAGAQSIGMAAIGMVVFGLATGGGSTLPIAFVAEVFGTRNIGSIKAVAAALGVFGSAIGPGVTGYMIDFGIGFETQLRGFALYFVFAGGFAWLASARVKRAVLSPSAP
jgi:MFS family permease